MDRRTKHITRTAGVREEETARGGGAKTTQHSGKQHTAFDRPRKVGITENTKMILLFPLIKKIESLKALKKVLVGT